MAPASHGIVARFFEARGFTVHGQRKDGKAKGIDQMITKDDKFSSVEVKAIRHDGKSYRIDILPTQQGIDLIAIVTKHGAVMVLPMGLFQIGNKRRSVSLGSVVGGL